jgi:hypothetical protein
MSVGIIGREAKLSVFHAGSSVVALLRMCIIALLLVRR